MELKDKLEEYSKKIDASIIKKPINAHQEGFNFALETVSANINLMLGNVKTYTLEDLKKEL